MSRQQLIKLFGAPPSPAWLVACQSCDTAASQCPGLFVSGWRDLELRHLPGCQQLLDCEQHAVDSVPSLNALGLYLDNSQSCYTREVTVK